MGSTSLAVTAPTTLDCNPPRRGTQSSQLGLFGDNLKAAYLPPLEGKRAFSRATRKRIPRTRMKGDSRSRVQNHGSIRFHKRLIGTFLVHGWKK
jgi:hypothetical protein